MWLVHAMSPEAGRAGGFFDARRIRGELDVDALRRALQTIVERHEALRTTFAVFDGVPMQVVHENVRLEVPMIDAIGLAREGQSALLARLVDEPFELSQPLLFRATLVRLASTEHLLLVAADHIVWDGWSTGILVRELRELYNAYSTGRPHRLPAVRIQFADYATWQRHRGTEALKEQLAYWRERLHGAPPLLDLPTDHPRPARKSYRGDRVRLWIDAPTLAGLAGHAQSGNTTLFMALAAAWATLLHRHSGAEEVVLGMPVAGRNRVELEDVIGYFINTLPLRVDCSADPSFIELVQRVRTSVLDLYAHQDVSFEQIVRTVLKQRDLSYSPVFQSLIVLHDPDPHGLELPGLSLEAVESSPSTAMFDLSLSMTQHGDRLHASFEYSTDLFERATIERIRDQFATLLSSIVASPSARISELGLLTSQDEEAIRLDSEGAYEPIPDIPLYAFASAHASAQPDAIAVVGEDESLTYAELEARSQEVAFLLHVVGLRPRRSVAVLLERSPRFVVTILAALRAGARCVPLDLSYPPDRVRAMVDIAAVDLVVTDAGSMGRAETLGVPILNLDSPAQTVGAELLEDEQEPSHQTDGARKPGPEDVAFILFTSGSTGAPKGVLLEHRGLVNLALGASRAFDLSPADRILQFASPSFDISLEEVFACLATGASLILRSKDMPLAGPGLLEWLTQRRVTVMDLPTAFWHEWVRDLDELDLRAPECLRLVAVGGEKASPAALSKWRRVASHVRWINTYGPTEASVTTTTYEPPTGWPSTGDTELPIGSPFTNSTVHILDAHRRMVPPGVHGELYIGGAGVARGYLDDDQTAARFVTLPSPSGERVYRTGDIVRRRPGAPIEFVGRVDRQVKLRGFRIDPAEVEAALLRDPRVSGAFAMLREDTTERAMLVAYVVVQDPARPALATELRKLTVDVLPTFAVPARIVPLSALPLTPNGKVDVTALPVPGADVPDRVRPPQDELEGLIAAIWSELLGRPVGMDSDFFELGGHSLLAARMFALLERRLGIQLPLATLIRSSTVVDLAQAVRDHRRDGVAPDAIVTLKPGDGRPPLLLVHDLDGDLLCYRELLPHLSPEQPVYGVPARSIADRPTAGIEEMARDYVADLRTFRPHGPYMLAGWSFAAVVAYEMARQLHRGGGRVSFLGLIDAIPDELRRPASAVARRRDETVSGISAVSPDSVRARHDAALRGYRTPPYDASAFLFRAIGSDEAAPADPRLEWSRLVRGDLQVCDIASADVDHFSILKEPHVGQLGRQLQAAITRTSRVSI